MGTNYLDDFEYSITDQSSLSISKEELKNGVVLYTNPAEGFINIGTVKVIKSVEIYNVMGQKTAPYIANQFYGNKVDIANLAKGVYVVKVGFDKEAKGIIRFVKE